MEQTCPVTYKFLIGDQLKKRHLEQMREKCQPPLNRSKIHDITYPYDIDGPLNDADGPSEPITCLPTNIVITESTDASIEKTATTRRISPNT